MLTVGYVVGGYRIEPVLGTGCMGALYLAADPALRATSRSRCSRPNCRATPASAQTFSQSYVDAAATTTAAQPAAPVPGLPKSRCTRVAGSNGLVPRFWCLATAGRYAIKAVARQLDTAHQQIAAQYRMLTG
jgi:hypothetical protein